MTAGQSPDAIDASLVLRVYAWIASTSGLLVYLWPTLLTPHLRPPLAFPAEPWAVTWDGVALLVPQGPWTIARLGAVLVVTSGCLAAGLARLADAAARRRALYVFALAHLVFGVMFVGQWTALLDRVLPPVIGWAPIVVGLVLSYAAVTGERGAAIHRSFVLVGSDDRDRHTVAVADRVTSMVALRSRYEDQVRRAARQEERARLARDLHDAVKQQLFVIQTAAATAVARFDDDRPGAHAALDDVRTATREAMAEMDALIDQLRTEPIENIGLVDALRRQCEALEFRTGAKVTFDAGVLPSPSRLPPGAQQNLFRGAQEALANVARHARAHHVTVSLRATGKALELAVRDDGAGFNPIEVAQGMGLRNMPERAAAAGGSFTVRSAPGKGSLVLFSVPYVARTPAEYRLRTGASAAALGLVLWLAQTLDATSSPWILGAALVAGIATSRYAAAYLKVRRHAEATS